MSAPPNQKNISYNINDELDLIEIFKILMDGKLIIILAFLVFSITAIFYSLSLPNIYQSNAILAPAESSSLSKTSSQFSSIASLAGLNTGSSADNKVSIGIEIVHSFGFFDEIINKNDNFLFLLIAPIDWDKERNELIINTEIYDVDSEKWVSTSPFSVNGVPSSQDAHRVFLKDFSMSENEITGLVSTSFNHVSPYVATELLNIVIMELNNKLRNEEILLASKSKQYLEEEVIKAQLSDVRVAISDLIQQQIGKIAMANSSPQYLFKVLANPYPPERKFKPKRSIIVILYSMFGIFVGCSIVLLRKFIYQSKRI
jgi:LPS O-antigen subunit length determinant protein (WzzB/FepE family)